MKKTAILALLTISSYSVILNAEDHHVTPSSLNSILSQVAPGDTVHLADGTYTNLRPTVSGSPGNFITFKAEDGALPIFEGGFGTYVETTASYLRFEGLISRGSSNSGFGNTWTDANCGTMSNGNLEFVNCIADGNGINGITFYCASGVLIENSIIAHNGNQDPSWSSGVNLFAAKGSSSDNIVRGNVSFENIDISSHHSDGSGYILDQNSEGALFENNIGFRNG